MNAGSAPALRVIIVSHANEEGNLGFALDASDLARDRSTGDRKPRTEFKELRDANAAGALPVADVKKIDAATRVEIRGCNIGRSQLMLDALDQAFGGATRVTAPTHKQQYSYRTAGKGKPLVTEESFFQYSIEDPGRTEVDGSWHYEVQADRVTSKGSFTETRTIITSIPPDPDALKAQAMADSGRPGAYVWTVEDEVKKGTLTRTVYREHTAWVIDRKIVDKAGTAHPPSTDRTFYGASAYPPPPPPTKGKKKP